MKVNDKQYAQLLFELVEDAGDDLDVVVNNFFAVLVKNNDVNRARRIVARFGDVWDEKKGVVNASVVSAFVVQSDTIDGIVRYVEEKTGANEVNIVSEVDEGIKGGVVIKYGDKVIDVSLKTRINDLKLSLLR